MQFGVFKKFTSAYLFQIAKYHLFFVPLSSSAFCVHLIDMFADRRHNISKVYRSTYFPLTFSSLFKATDFIFCFGISGGITITVPFYRYHYHLLFNTKQHAVTTIPRRSLWWVDTFIKTKLTD